MRIVLGLGNPGARYARTRHNVGFMTAARLVSKIGASFHPEGDTAEVARGKACGEDVLVARPLTWMNLSGRAAGELAGRHEGRPEDFIVVYDDVALPLGRVRLRERGSSGGHKGMQSVIEALETEDVPRLRLGILGEGGRDDLADYVLEEFAAEEEETVDKMIERSCDALLLVFNRGVRFAASRFNRADCS